LEKKLAMVDIARSLGSTSVPQKKLGRGGLGVLSIPAMIRSSKIVNCLQNKFK
jgi:hypothetical protein